MDGWFRTGDVATIDAEGYIQIMDRTKDLVKSGGAWISGVDLETALMAQPKVMEAAVVGVFHPKWQERPLACIAPLPQYKDQITKQELLDFLAPRVAKWWLPDDIVFIESVPKTSVGKFNKPPLRGRFKDYRSPSSRSITAALLKTAHISLPAHTASPRSTESAVAPLLRSDGSSKRTAHVRAPVT